MLLTRNNFALGMRFSVLHRLIARIIPTKQEFTVSALVCGTVKALCQRVSSLVLSFFVVVVSVDTFSSPSEQLFFQ